MSFYIISCVFLISTLNFSLACDCGLEGASTRIYKGSPVPAHKYPWLAHIRSYAIRGFPLFGQCGGSLIDNKHIITAAHCVHDSNGNMYKASNIDVFLGRVNAQFDSSKPVSVSKIWAHPEFDIAKISNDIAILTLSKAVEYTSKIAPICLSNSEGGLSKLTVTGWGVTNAESQTNDKLLDVEVDFITKDECTKIKKTYYDERLAIPSFLRPFIEVPEIDETHICAINKSTGGDACEGDSGGPLMKKGSDGRWYLMGIVSGSWANCGEPDTAGLYTRVTHFRETIKSIAPNSCWRD